jgi:signal transduction histidine kinase
MLGELGGEIESAIGDIRRLVYALRPPALDELGLVGALRAQAARYQSQAADEDDRQDRQGTDGEPKLLVSIDAPPDLPPLPAAVEVAAYRIVSEALTNAARHAFARSCRITLALDKALRVEIRDDGVGLTPLRWVGIGLVSMRERAEELGGTCTITSAPGEGVWVLAVLPLAKE